MDEPDAPQIEVQNIDHLGIVWPASSTEIGLWSSLSAKPPSTLISPGIKPEHLNDDRATFANTTNTFVVYTSNAFAILARGPCTSCSRGSSSGSST